MKAISKYFAMCAIALLGLANTSCMSDDMDGTPSCDYDVELEYAKNGVPPSEKNCHNCNCNVFELNESKNALSFSRYQLIEFQISSHRVPGIIS